VSDLASSIAPCSEDETHRLPHTLRGYRGRRPGHTFRPDRSRPATRSAGTATSWASPGADEAPREPLDGRRKARARATGTRGRATSTARSTLRGRLALGEVDRSPVLVCGGRGRSPPGWTAGGIAGSSRYLAWSAQVAGHEAPSSMRRNSTRRLASRDFRGANWQSSPKPVEGILGSASPRAFM
jgi:hypothetical protein